METLRNQLIKIVKESKILKEVVSEDEDIVLGTIDKHLDKSVDIKVKEVLGD